MPQKNPAAAGGWISQFPEGEARQSALANVVNVWGNSDRAALENWPASLPQNSLRTEALEFSASPPLKNSAP
jgi:hypothetical protein